MEYQQARPSTPDEVPASQADAALKSVRQTVDTAIANVSDRTREMVRYADRRVQASPWTAVGIGFGIGTIFGVLVALAASSQQPRGFLERWR
jgi:ElaB/YqjD/DUF883 family membrane-anchored ribosome-binding protein